MNLPPRPACFRQHGVITRRKPRQAYVRVERDGSLRCADEFSRDAIRKCKPKPGELVRVVFSKPRDYGQWKKAHQLGALIAINIDEFAEFQHESGHIDAHGALKKLQRLSGVECEDSEIELPGLGKLTIRVPSSLAFDEMDEPRFQSCYATFCDYLKKRWWNDLEQWQIEEMANLVGTAA